MDSLQQCEVKFQRISADLEQYKEVKDFISQLVRKGVIQDSNSAYASPIMLACKADGNIRLCVYYRKLNQKTKKDAFSLPHIDESFDAL